MILVCETFHDRRRRHHRDLGRSQAADTPSSSFRTSHPPYNTTPHNTRSRGVKNRGAPDQNHRFATGLARAHGFWVLRSSRQVGAGSRGRVTTDGSPSSHQNSAVSQNSGAPAQRRATQPRPCARADTTRPATANSPPVCRECNTAFIPSRYSHYTITYYIRLHHYILHSHAPTDPTGVGSQGIGKSTCGKTNCLLHPLGTRRRMRRPHRHPGVPFRTRPKK